ncbi:MAG: PQQ-binding-like beta-propeller repeat protein, partial [Planctomycetota bacterium]|nr:PQQ-binding-like beta-propeller repeat protein [Planctomycetota bacterium]
MNAAVKSWTVDGKNQLWKSPIGGRTTPILLGDRLFFNTVAGEGDCLGERVVCLDPDTGRLIWEHKFNVYLTTIVEARVAWTSVVGDPSTKYVYAHGTGGMFYCFDFDGNIVWRRSLTEFYNRVSGYGGRVHTPIIDGDNVIISFLSSNWGSHGKPGHRYVAFDKMNGAVVWWSQPGGKPLDTTYSVPVTTVLNGRRMIVAGNADGGVYGLESRTGRKIWGFKMSKRGINTSTVMDGKYAYVTHSEENLNTTEMGAVVCLDASMTGDLNENDKGVVWRHDGITAGYASPAIAKGRLYVVDNAGKLYCFDAKTGKLYWTHTIGRVGKGSPTVTADGVIYATTVNGRFLILQDQGDECEQLDVEQFEASDDSAEIYGSPIVSEFQVFFMTRSHTFCLQSFEPTLFNKPPPAPPEEPGLPEEKEGALSAATTLLIVPGEVTLSPGERINFRPRLFDADGREIGATSAAWTAPETLGTIQPDGTFTATDKKAFMAGLVEAKIGKIKGTVRVRVTPPLPIEEDFDSMPAGKNPPGWVGLGKKTQLTILGRDNIVLQKLASKKFPSVPFMR